MTEQEKAAMDAAANGGNGKNSSNRRNKSALTIRSAEEVQLATRTEIEAISDMTAEALNDAVLTRTTEKLVFNTLQNTDRIVGKASEQLADFLPRLLASDSLMNESELTNFMLEAG